MATTKISIPPQPTVPLSMAARRLRLSWAGAWRLVLTGCLDGELVNNRWLITEESLERVAQERDTAATATAAAA